MRNASSFSLCVSLGLCLLLAGSLGAQTLGGGRAQIDPHACVHPPSFERWSDPATWGGVLPANGDTVTIPAGRRIVLDVSPPPLKELTVQGRLVVGCGDLLLTVDRIVVTGRFDVGSPAAPHADPFRIDLTERFHSPVDPLARTFEVVGGRLEMHGTPRVSWVQLGATAPAGASSIQLATPVDWKPGETIVLASTDFSQDQAEERVVTAVTSGGTVVWLDQPLTSTHWGEVETLGVDERGEVALIDRNIRVHGPAGASAGAPDELGGHMRFMGSGSTVIHLSWIELDSMGEGGQLGRYPVHFHQLGDMTGSYVKGLSIHHSSNRSVTLHGTHNVLVADTLSYETLGHAFFFEDGTETGNRLLRNLGLGTRRPKFADQLVPSDNSPATYWVQNTDNILIGNVAAGSTDYGFWYDIPSVQSIANPPVFIDNVAHSNGRNGFYKSDYNALPVSWPGPGLYQGFTAYKNKQIGISHRTVTGRTVWINARVADNGTGLFLASDGLQKDGASDTILIDSVVVGESDNVGMPVTAAEIEYGRSLPSPGNPGDPLLGHEIYEGHVDVRDTDYARFRTAVIGGKVREAAAFGRTKFDTRWAIDPRNSVMGVTFDDANRIYLEPSAPLASGNASMLIHDVDGSLTGLPDMYVAANTLLLVPTTGSVYDPISNSVLVPGATAGNRYANLRLRDYGGVSQPSIHLASVTRSTSYDVGQSMNSAAYAMNVPTPDDYEITFGPDLGPRSFGVELRFGVPQTTTTVAVEYPAPGPSSVTLNGAGIAAAGSLATLGESATSGWFYDAAIDRVFLKFVLGGSGSTVTDGTEIVLKVTE
jgi:cell migration-inducing and hyaluronan-binding protein